MPRTALANVVVDHQVPLSGMAALLGRLVRERVETTAPIPRDLELEARVAETGYSDEHITEQVGELTSLSCPECGGPLCEKGVGAHGPLSLPRRPRLRGRLAAVGGQRGDRVLAVGRREAVRATLQTFSIRWPSATATRSALAWCGITKRSRRKLGNAPICCAACSFVRRTRAVSSSRRPGAA